MKKVLIAYKFMPQYRVDFFNQLKEKLLDRDIELTLVYGKMKNDHSKKKDEVDIPWAHYRENIIFRIGGTELLWQPILDLAKKNDLVIVEHANKLLVNYILMIIRKFTDTKMAFGGHGRNMQGKEEGIKNKLKYFYISFCDHWFAYTDGVKEFLIQKNVSEDIISVVNNAIDTKALQEQYSKCSNEEADGIKKQLQITGENIAIYSGSLYDIKKIDFLIEAAVNIQKTIKDFHLIVIGSGPDNHIVEEAAIKHSWIHFVGPKFGKDRVAYFKAASIFMLPGAVGLAVLDAFATKTPMITTDIPLHGPEIDYLENNYNGVITKFDMKIYVKEVINLLRDTNKLNKLKKECTLSSEKYTVEHMVQRFSDGVEKCIKER